MKSVTIVARLMLMAGAGATADGANTTRQSAERVGVAAAEIKDLIGQFSY